MPLPSSGRKTSRLVYYAAASVDGFIADKDGGVHWLEPFNSPELGYEAFLAKVSGVVMGRATYDQALTFGPWPYGSRRGLVVTSRPIENLPAGVVAVTADDLADAVTEVRNEITGDLWVVGGGQTARLCLHSGLLDELELYVVPVLLGDGVPLFSRRGAYARLALIGTTSFSNGVVMLRYARKDSVALGRHNSEA